MKILTSVVFRTFRVENPPRGTFPADSQVSAVRVPALYRRCTYKTYPSPHEGNTSTIHVLNLVSLGNEGPQLAHLTIKFLRWFWFLSSRSKSLTMKAANKVALLVPEVGTASDHVALASGGGEAAMDDLYMEGISIRRGFASEFIALLEVRAVTVATVVLFLLLLFCLLLLLFLNRCCSWSWAPNCAR